MFNINPIETIVKIINKFKLEIMSNISNEQLTKNAFAMFDQKTEDIVTEVEGGGGGMYFELDPKKSPDSKVSVLVRFIPNIDDPNTPIINKVSYTLPDADFPESKFTVLSERSLNANSRNCPIANTFFSIKNKENAQWTKQAQQDIKYRKSRVCLMQIIKYPTDPTMEGKIVKYNLSDKVFELLDSKLHPSKDDVQLGTKAVNPFEAFGNAPLMTIKAGLKMYPSKSGGEASEGRDHGGSEWTGGNKVLPILIDGKPLDIGETDESKQAAANQLLELLTADTTPRLTTDMYKEWDEETKLKVTKSLNMVVARITGDAQPEAKQDEKQPETTQKVENKEPENAASTIANSIANEVIGGKLA